MKKMYLIFESTHHELMAEKILKNFKIRPDVVGVPPGHSSGCAIAIKLSKKEYQAVKYGLEKEGVDYKLLS